MSLKRETDVNIHCEKVQDTHCVASMERLNNCTWQQFHRKLFIFQGLQEHLVMFFVPPQTFHSGHFAHLWPQDTYMLPLF